MKLSGALTVIRGSVHKVNPHTQAILGYDLVLMIRPQEGWFVINFDRSLEIVTGCDVSISLKILC